ncbi:hypothetical protein AaE_002631 [Aphanomyces astaci]|uniref:HTH CENPB-type domain-containing protein n=1 Tax=Aphanomyces astaci TaxID=112090 RepID=A0A6A5AT32_APHAT|nr:hypothetical protein AaE_002631 [Aphanomyces astaci]
MGPARPASHRLATGRPRVKNNPRNGPAKHQRVFTTYAKKLHILKWLQNNTMESTLDTFYKGVTCVARQTAWKKILHWRSQIDFITSAATKASTASNRTIRAMGTATTLDFAAEENIANWVCQLRADGVPVSRLLLSCKALEIAKDIGLSAAQFKASLSWVAGFFRRWGMSMRAKTRSGQSNLEEGEAALDEFASNYPLFLVLKSQQSKIKEVVQDNLTNRNGFGRQVWQDIEELHERHPSRIFGNPRAWWNSTISIAFLTYHFGHRQGQNVTKVLLLWDDFSAHFTDDVVAYADKVNVVLAKIPPTFTWICQPWMKPLKAYLRRQWVNHLRNEIDNSKDSQGTFKLRPPDRFELVEWVNDAWDSLSKKTIVSGFAKCKIIEATHPQTTEHVEGHHGHDHDGHDQHGNDNHPNESILQMGVENIEIMDLNDDDDELPLAYLDNDAVGSACVDT